MKIILEKNIAMLKIINIASIEIVVTQMKKQQENI